MSTVARAALWGGLLAAVFGSGSGCSKTSGAPAPSPSASAVAAEADPVVAEVGGERILQSELDRRLLQRVAQDRLYEMRKQTLDELLAERLLDKEARARGMSRDELLRVEVEAKAQPVSETEVKELFDRSGLAQQGATLAALRPQIESSVRERRRSERRQVFMEELRSRANVKVALVEPRTQVTVPADAPALGPAGAPVTMVEFLDYQCPYCHKVQGVVDEVLAAYPGKVRFVHRDFLLGNPRSLPSARAARCAGEQGKFWEYHRRLLTEAGADDAALKAKAAALGLDTARFGACVASDKHDAAIQQASQQGQEAGVSGTPTFFINGRRLVGVRPVQEFRQVIEEELKRAG